MLGYQMLLNKYENHGSKYDFLQKEGHGKRAAEVQQKFHLTQCSFPCFWKKWKCKLPRMVVCMVTWTQVFYDTSEC